MNTDSRPLTPTKTANQRVLLLAGAMEIRGSSTQTLTLARRLPEFGFLPTIVCSQNQLRRSPAGGMPGLTAGLPITVIPQLASSLLKYPAWALLAHDLRQAPPDLIHIERRTELKLGQYLARVLQRPCVLSMHDYLERGESPPFDFSVLRLIIAISESVRDELLKQTAISPERVRVILGGITEPAQPPTPILAPGRIPVIGTAGPLEAAKGLHFFVEAMPLVLREFPQTQFLIAGAGPEEPALRRQCAAEKVATQVTFCPNLVDLTETLQALDVYVLPSPKQGLGLIMMEAMARERAVVATRAGGVYSVIDDGCTGLLAAPGDASALAERILELLRNPLRAREIARAGRESVLARFPAQNLIEQTAALYRTVLSGG